MGLWRCTTPRRASGPVEVWGFQDDEKRVLCSAPLNQEADFAPPLRGSGGLLGPPTRDFVPGYYRASLRDYAVALPGDVAFLRFRSFPPRLAARE